MTYCLRYETPIVCGFGMRGAERKQADADSLTMMHSECLPSLVFQVPFSISDEVTW